MTTPATVCPGCAGMGWIKLDGRVLACTACPEGRQNARDVIARAVGQASGGLAPIPLPPSANYEELPAKMQISEGAQEETEKLARTREFIQGNLQWFAKELYPIFRAYNIPLGEAYMIFKLGAIHGALARKEDDDRPQWEKDLGVR